MASVSWLAIAGFVSLLSATDLYEEPLAAARLIREGQGRQMTAYGESLPASGFPNPKRARRLERLKAR